MMNAVQMCEFSYLVVKYLKNKKKCSNRKWWVHPINSERHLRGHFYTLYARLKADEDKFFNYFRMSIKSFDELLYSIREYIIKQDTNMRSSIPPEEMLAVTLRYLGSGCSLKDLHYNFRIGRSTAGEIVKAVCRTIWDVMKGKCIPIPDELDWNNTAEGFRNRANFPNCVGAVDGKHIRIIKPIASGSSYINYKHYFSIVLLAIADSNYNFIYVDIGSYGKDSDSTIFRNSSLYRGIENNTLMLPKPNEVPGVAIPLPFAFVGDEAFGLSPNLLRPYSGKHLSVPKRVFNYRLSRARRYVECTFGILSNKWRILHRAIDVDVEFAIDIVKSCCVLHNFVRKRDGYSFDDTLTIVGLLEDFINDETITVNRSINRYRDALANYFVSEAGELPWQYNKI